jgi:hypothetical protein
MSLDWVTMLATHALADRNHDVTRVESNDDVVSFTNPGDIWSKSFDAEPKPARASSRDEAGFIPRVSNARSILALRSLGLIRRASSQAASAFSG